MHLVIFALFYMAGLNVQVSQNVVGMFFGGKDAARRDLVHVSF